MNGNWRDYSSQAYAGTRERMERTLYRWQWEIKAYIAAVFLGDREWGSVRLMLLAAGVALFLMFGRVTEAIPARPWVGQAAANVPAALQPMAASVLGFVDTMATRQALRHALPPIAGVLLAIAVGAAFINDLFELNDPDMAYAYLRSALFGGNYPTLAVKDCKLAPEDEANPLVKIGGPGYVHVGVGLAAVCETTGGPADVLGTGLHFLRRFETLREVFDLRDQFRAVPEIKALTKDGIPVTVRDARMSFRLRTRHNKPRTEGDPYPYSIAALRDAAYNKVVGPTGTAPWPDAVAGAVAGQIRSMVARRRLDDLVGPTADGARAEMLAEFYNAAARKKYAKMGAEILWVSLGHFENPNAVAAQRIRTWQADWQKLAKISEAEAEGERLAMEEQLRGEALVHLVESIEQSTQFKADAGLTAADRFFVLMAETLEAYARRGAMTGGGGDDMLRLARELRRIPSATSATSATGSMDLDSMMGWVG